MVTGMTVYETGIFIVVNMEVMVLQDVIFHSFIYRYQCFGETSYLFRKKLLSPFFFDSCSFFPAEKASLFWGHCLLLAGG